MEEIVANVDNITLDIEVGLNLQLWAEPLPFARMDKSASAVCESYLKGTCSRGELCPFRHIKRDRTVVCKHWLRGLCKKSDECEFLHQYDMTKMPECHFYKVYKECSNKECPFQHIDPEAKVKDCPWYDRGFCRHGPNCRYRHTKRIMCPNYLAGFCIDGPDCKLKHPKFDLPVSHSREQSRNISVVCHLCRQTGHKALLCPNIKKEVRGTKRSSTEHDTLAQTPSEISEMERMNQHIDPEAKVKDCLWYDRGFCRHGPNCRYRHTKRIMCPNYLAGFCIDGPDCKLKHPKFHLPVSHSTEKSRKISVVCHLCRQTGHKALSCPNIKKEVRGTKRSSTEHDTLAQTPSEISEMEKMNLSHQSLVEAAPFKRRRKENNADGRKYGQSSVFSNEHQSCGQFYIYHQE